MKTHRCPMTTLFGAPHRSVRYAAPRSKSVRWLIALVAAAMFVASCSGSNPVEGQSPQAPAVDAGVQNNDAGDADVEFSDPSQLQVLQVWCVYEFDTDACVELEADYGYTVDDNYGIGEEITGASVEELTGLCAAGAGDRVACAEVGRR